MSNLNAKNLAASICPQVASVISIIGSFVVMREVLIDHKEKKGKAIPRILFALCIADLVFSSGWILATWPSPKELDYLWFNIGNQATCDFQAFLLNFGLLASPLFNISLAFFCLLMVRYKWSDERLRTIEPWVHGGIWTFSLVCAIFPIYLGIYNNAWTVCWFESSPAGCKDSFRYGDEATCERGDNAWLYAVAFTVFPVMTCVVLSFVIMGMLYCFVRRTESRTRKYVVISNAAAARQRRSARAFARSAPAIVSFSNETNTKPSFDRGIEGGEMKSFALTKESAVATRPTLEHQTLSFERRQGLERQTSSSSNISSTSSMGSSRSFTPKSHAVASKCFFYTLSFVVTYALHCYVTLVFFITGGFWYYLHLSMYIMLSLQGFCNSLVFAQGRKMKTPEGRLFQKIFCCNLGLLVSDREKTKPVRPPAQHSSETQDCSEVLTTSRDQEAGLRHVVSVTDTGKPGGEDVDGDIEPMVVAGGDQEEDNDLSISSRLSC